VESLETSNGKLQIVVRSRKVLVRIEKFDVPVMTQDGRVRFFNKGTLKVYDYVFDDAQSRALRETRELASRSGLTLEVTDLTRQGLLTRMLRSALRKGDAQVWLDARSWLSSRTAKKSQERCEDVSSPVARL
jgi:hypothetical protein